jgi:hypothetical protein
MKSIEERIQKAKENYEKELARLERQQQLEMHFGEEFIPHAFDTWSSVDFPDASSLLLFLEEKEEELEEYEYEHEDRDYYTFKGKARGWLENSIKMPELIVTVKHKDLGSLKMSLEFSKMDEKAMEYLGIQQGHPRGVTDSEHHYFTGHSMAQLRNIRIPVKEWSWGQTKGYYGGDKAQVNDLYERLHTFWKLDEEIEGHKEG